MTIFQNTVSMILKEFPKVKNWINWWTQPINAAMIFRSHEVLQPELQDHHIRISNGTESFHRDLYRIVQTKQSILDTLPHIFSYLKNDAANFERVDKGTNSKNISKNNNNNSNDNNIDHDNHDNNDNSSNSNSKCMDNTATIGYENNNKSKMETDSDNDMDNEQLLKEAVQNKNKKIQDENQNQDSDDGQEDEASVISGLYSPASDGNHGWRAAAYNLYGDESAWKKIKEGMEVKRLQEIDYFKTIFDSQEVYELMEILKLRGDYNINSDDYFRFDSYSQLLAELCNIAVIVYSDTGFQDCTYLPFLSDPRGFNESDNLPVPCILYLKGNHILNVQFIHNNNYKVYFKAFTWPPVVSNTYYSQR
ncbi:hypothetical protein INT45_000412 [Circinella minor]|uniref:OTU domain-containing protein n=1 Tax=Circinella minor TaxID=1195481 RepID=A0A8H7RUT4_9FUNG|nr:hypothetical protein INT45_000412 [Circinella minor]